MTRKKGKELKAIILAGGRGKRLRPITDYVPKPLVPLNNLPIIEWQIKYLKNFGVNEVIVCTGYMTEMIQHFLSIKDNFGIKIRLSIEKTPLGTGGAIKQAGKLIKDKSFLVINGDTITDIDLNKLLKKPNSIAGIELRTKFGIMETENDKVKRFREKKEISNTWMNAGIYHLQKEVLKDLPKKGDIEKTVFPDYAKKGLLNTVKFQNVNWYSIDSFKDIEECSMNIHKIIK
jgi:NDP-sugar pyrophosphorylase family protein